jgi:hypothetical protein
VDRFGKVNPDDDTPFACQHRCRAAGAGLCSASTRAPVAGLGDDTIQAAASARRQPPRQGAHAPRRQPCPQRRSCAAMGWGWGRAQPTTVPLVARWTEGALEAGPAKRGAGGGMEAPRRGEATQEASPGRTKGRTSARGAGAGGRGETLDKARRTRRRRWPTSVLLWQGQHGHHRICASCY